MYSKLSLLLVALAGASAGKCPGSAAWIHAKCEFSVAFTGASCAVVQAEVAARIKGTDGWCDPHNKGTYTLDKSSPTEMDIHRKTGDGKYTDKQVLTFAAAANGGCTMSACSESQVTSVMDYSTNYCDLHDLYCGSADKCKFVVTDLSYSENNISCSSGQHDMTKCQKTCGPTLRRVAPKPTFVDTVMA